MIDPHVNPQTTSSSGAFSWMAAAGTYKVRATSPGCIDPTTGTSTQVEGGPYVLPPPAVGILLTLPCTLAVPSPPSITGLSSSLVPSTGGDIVVYGTGLAKTVSVTVAGTPAKSFKVLSPYAVQIAAPAGSGAGHLVITTPSGASVEGPNDQVTYLPTAKLEPAIETTTALIVNPAATTARQAVTLTANVKPIGSTSTSSPTGSVTFSDGAVVIGAGSLGADGKAEMVVTDLTVGDHPLIAAYAGDLVYGGSRSSAVPLAVAQAGTTTILVTEPNTSESGQAITLTAAVSSASGIPTGTVTFSEGGSPLGAAAVGPSGEASLIITPTSVGNHSFAAAYSGDKEFAPSTATASHVVANPVATSRLTLTASERKPVAGQSVQFIANGREVGPRVASLRIIEYGTARPVAICTGVTTCAASITHDPGTWRYQAVAADSRGRVIDRSTTAIVTWSRPEIELATSSKSAPRGGQVTLTASASIDVGQTPYVIRILDEVTDRVAKTCTSGTTCTAVVGNTKGTHRFMAAIMRPPKKIIAESPTRQVVWR